MQFFTCQLLKFKLKRKYIHTSHSIRNDECIRVWVWIHLATANHYSNVITVVVECAAFTRTRTQQSCGAGRHSVCVFWPNAPHTHTPATVINFHLSCRRRKKRVDGYRKLAIHIKFKACWFSQMFARSQSFTLSLSYFSSPALHEPLESATTTECSRTHTQNCISSEINGIYVLSSPTCQV